MQSAFCCSIFKRDAARVEEGRKEEDEKERKSFFSFLFTFFRLAFDDKAHSDRTNKTSFFLRRPLSLSRFPTPRAARQSLRRALSEVAKQNSENPALSVKHRSRTMAEPYDTRGAHEGSSPRSTTTSPSSPSTTARKPSTTSRRSCLCRSLSRSTTCTG